MPRRRKTRAKKALPSQKEGRALLERWRKNLLTVEVELKQPRVIDVLPLDFVSGEPVQRKGESTRRFRGQVIYFTPDDIAVRRPSGAILVIDTYEIVAISDGKSRFEPA